VDVAHHVTGIDPSVAMLSYAPRPAGRCDFVAAQGERMPFGGGVFDLITAAGALNWSGIEDVLREAARVLGSRGELVIYDFGMGELDGWVARFRGRYPAAPALSVIPENLPLQVCGLTLDHVERFVVTLEMPFAAYLAYVMTETNVELALESGTPLQDIEAWCRETLQPLFAAGGRSVPFPGFVARISGRTASR